jgi:hypothetical protein
VFVVLPFFSKDAWLAAKNLKHWIAMDGRVDYKCLLAYDNETDADEVKGLAEQYFNQVDTFTYRAPRIKKWPNASNRAFVETSQFVASKYQEPWLWCESDSVALSKGWIKAIDDCHKAGGKPFTGHWNFQTGVWNGVSVYPHKVRNHTYFMSMSNECPWDVVASKKDNIQKKLNIANHLFQHIWEDERTKNPYSFTSAELVHKTIRPGVVLFHRCKDGTLIDQFDAVNKLNERLVVPRVDNALRTAVVYVFPAFKYEDKALRFVQSYQDKPPEYPHELFVVVNGGVVTPLIEKLFAPLKCRFFLHSNVGWDIGAFIAISRRLDCEMMLCLGANTHFSKEGWLKRYAEAWQQHGPGLYGTLASNQARPHLCTTGFTTTPELLSEYPYKIETYEDRLGFEWAMCSFWRMVAKKGLPVKMVTWDGVWNMDEIRKPDNVLWKGDQSNCLVYFRHSDDYFKDNPAGRNLRQRRADTINPTISRLKLDVDVNAEKKGMLPIEL